MTWMGLRGLILVLVGVPLGIGLGLLDAALGAMVALILVTPGSILIYPRLILLAGLLKQSQRYPG